MFRKMAKDANVGGGRYSSCDKDFRGSTTLSMLLLDSRCS
jgi:hypothetical protein